MSRHPFRDVAVAGIFNTEQARSLNGHTTRTIQLEAALGALDHVGLDIAAVDGVVGNSSAELLYDLGLSPAWASAGLYGLAPLVAGAAAIATRRARTVLIVEGAAGVYTDRTSTAPWTRPSNEFVASVGMFTAAEFALVARRHMDLFATTPEQMATVAALIRNNGHVNPDAAYYGRGPLTAEDVLASRMIADPFHLLDCSTTSEGAIGMVLAHVDIARDLRHPPVYILGAGSDEMGPAYQHPPAWDLRAPHSDEIPLGYIGRRAARSAFAEAGLQPADVQVVELYDAFSFEIIRQLEAFEFVQPGEGGPFAASDEVGPGGRLPVNTDGGLLSYSHSGSAQALQRAGRAVEQIQGLCTTNQVPGAEVALASYGGAGAFRTDCVVFGSARP